MPAQKQGSHKDYGPKMSNPRIGESREHRGCGPLARYRQYVDAIKKYHQFDRELWSLRKEAAFREMVAAGKFVHESKRGIP